MINSKTAKDCFEENIGLIGGHQSNPEKFNLYNGLANLAVAISGIEETLQRLETRITNLENQRR